MKQRHASGSKTRFAGYLNRQSTGNGERGIPFWQAENGVWLTSTVAVSFLSGKGNFPHEVTTCSLNIALC